MPPKPDEQAVRERFDDLYQLVQAPIMREIERSVCGCDYGGTSWTTRREAEQVGALLDLGPGRRLLEVGAGSGWPGLYLARTTGCDVTLLDLPLAGLRIAAERAVADRLSGACWPTVPTCRSGAARSMRSATRMSCVAWTRSSRSCAPAGA